MVSQAPIGLTNRDTVRPEKQQKIRVSARPRLKIRESQKSLDLIKNRVSTWSALFEAAYLKQTKALL